MLKPGDYNLNVRGAVYPFEMFGKSITQLVVAAHSNGTLTFIKVSLISKIHEFIPMYMHVY